MLSDPFMIEVSLVPHADPIDERDLQAKPDQLTVASAKP
jgi:hypothetical protein